MISLPRPGTISIAIYAAALLVLLGFLCLMGSHYFILPVVQRADHPFHDLLAPGGSLGLAAGVLGTGLMMIMHLYTARKALIGVRWLGPIDQWLRFHIVCGILGPAFILLHGGFKLPEGMIAVGFWCMVLVALSGVFGRYVFGFLPRLTNGRALAWEDALAQLATLRGELVAATADATGDAIGEAVEEVQNFEFEAHTLMDLLRLQGVVRTLRRRVDTRIAEAQLPPETANHARRVLREQLRLKRGLEASRVAHRLLRYWHLFHRPLAKAMYVIVLLHVVVAVLFGDSLTRLASLTDLL